MRRGLRGLANVLIVAGGLLLIDAGLTFVWQEPVSALYARWQQDRLEDDLARFESGALSAAQRNALRRLRTERRRVAFLARALRREAGSGDPIGRLTIPRIGESHVIVEGTTAAPLRNGPGHYAETPLPGTRGTAAVAGHRTTYGAPFRRLDQLRRGDVVTADMPYARVSYRVERVRIVDPGEVSVLRRRPHDALVLTACHPLYSAAQRIVAFARQSRVEPRGRARLSAWPRIKALSAAAPRIARAARKHREILG